MRIRSSIPLIFAASVFALFQTSCGGSSSNPAPGPNPSPGVVSPSPSASPTSTLTWSEVSVMSQCPSHPLDCPTANGFNVSSSGAYSIDSQGPAGNVSRSDLAQLNAIASIYAANNGSFGFSCTATPTIPGSPGDTTVSITYSDGSSQTILTINTASQQTCILGSLPNAVSLTVLMNSLAAKYNPTSTPPPSPEPSPSPSPSES